MRIVGLLFLFCNVFFANAQNVSSYYNLNTEAYISFFNERWKNPALMAQYPYHNYTELSFKHDLSKAEELYLIQDGNKAKHNQFSVQSFVKDKNRYYYGDARYSKGLQSNQNWMSASHYNLLQPYVVADTLGGDLHTEQYRFSGGYGCSWEKCTLGLHGRYTADTQFRQLDPRPLNTIYNLELSAGLAYSISSKYLLGFDVKYDSYKQNSDINDFTDDYEHTSLYMRGFGFTDAYFGNLVSRDEVNYDADGYGLALNLLPQKTNNGWFATTQWFKRKVVQESDRTHQTISENHINTFGLESGFQWTTDNVISVIKLQANTEIRAGWEFNYTAGGVLVNFIQQYDQRTHDVKLLWLNMKKGDVIDFFYQLGSAYTNFEAIHHSPYANQSYSTLQPEFKCGGSFRVKHLDIAITQQLKYRHALSSQLVTSELAFENANEQMVVPNHLFYTADNTHYHTTLRMDYHLSKKYTLFIKGDFQRINYRNYAPTDHYAIACGVVL